MFKPRENRFAGCAVHLSMLAGIGRLNYRLAHSKVLYRTGESRLWEPTGNRDSRGEFRFFYALNEHLVGVGLDAAEGVEKADRSLLPRAMARVAAG